MYTKEKFHETVAILVAAYMNDTLRHGDCAACAVGNIVAARMGLRIVQDPSYIDCNQKFMMWSNGEYPNEGWFQVTRAYEGFSQRAIEQIEASSYTAQQLRQIEKSFESANFVSSYDDYILNGLIAVVDVLCEIHGMNEVDKKEAKELFVKV